MSRHSHGILDLLLPLCACTAVWLILVDGDLSSFIIGAPCIVAAVLVGRHRISESGITLRPLRLARFIPFFLKESLRGGVDAASRAFGTRPRLSCSVISFQSSLPPGAPRVFFANVVGLLPGTLTTTLEDETLRVHILDDSQPVSDDLQALEREVARLFAVSKN